jgi:hypothetical protein
MDMFWRDLMKYPHLVPDINGEFEDLLDALEDIIPIRPVSNDRVGTFIMWISFAVEIGLVTRSEKRDLQHYLIHGYGGF